MKERLTSAPSIDREEAGESVEAHGYIVTPVVRVRGRAGAGSDDKSSWRYGWAAIRPVKMRVVDPTGQVKEVRLVNPQAQSLATLLGVGLLVALLGLLIPLLSRGKQKPD